MNIAMDDYSEYSYLRNDEPVEVPYTTIPATIFRHSKRDERSVAQTYINWETFEKEQVTFTEIYQTAKIFAEGSVKLGIEKSDIVALGSDNTPEWIIAMVGIQMSGAVPLMFLFNLKDRSDIEQQLLKVQDKCKAICFTAGYNNNNISVMNSKYHGVTEKGRIISPSLPNLKWAILLSDKDNQDYITMTEVCKMGDSESLWQIRMMLLQSLGVREAWAARSWFHIHICPCWWRASTIPLGGQAELSWTTDLSIG